MGVFALVSSIRAKLGIKGSVFGLRCLRKTQLSGLKDREIQRRPKITAKVLHVINLFDAKVIVSPQQSLHVFTVILQDCMEEAFQY